MTYMQNILMVLTKQSHMDTNWKQQENRGNVNYFFECIKRVHYKKGDY